MTPQPRNVCPHVVGGACIGFGFDLGPIHVDTEKGVHVDDPGKFIAHFSTDAAKGVAAFMKDPVGTSKNIADQMGHFAADYASNMAGFVSLIPGIGTPISSAIEAGLATLAGGSPLSIAIHAAYGLIPIPPGIKNVTNQILNVAIAIGDQLMAGKKLDDAVINTILSKVPKGIPFARQVADTLIHLIVTAVSGHPTTAPGHAIAARPRPAAPPPHPITKAPLRPRAPPVRAPAPKVLHVRPPPPPPKVLQFHTGPAPAPPGVRPVPLSPPPSTPPTPDAEWVCQLGPNASFECGWV